MYSEDELLEELERISSEYSEAPTWREVKQNGNIGPETICNGLEESWTDLLSEMDFEHDRINRRNIKTWERQEFLDAVEEYCADLDEVPLREEAQKEFVSFPNHNGRWGVSWKDILLEVGYDKMDMPCKYLPEYALKNILDSEIQEYIESVNGWPRKSNFQKYCSHPINPDRFYSEWKKALEENGIREKMLEDIKKCSKNSVLTQEQYDLYGQFSNYRVISIFGGWEEVLDEGDLNTQQAQKHSQRYSRKEVIRIIQKVSERYSDGSETITQDDLQKSSFHLQLKTVKRYFSSWNEALREAGFRVNVGVKYTREELIEDIHRVSEEYCDGTAPTSSQINDYGRFHIGNFEEEFDSWNDAVREAGFEPNRRIYEESFNIDEFVREVREEFSKFSEYKLFKRKECSLENAKINNVTNSWRRFMEEYIIDESWEKYHKSTFLNDVERVRNILDQRSISVRDYKEFDGSYHSYAKAYRLFNGWYNVLDELGLPEKENPMMNMSGEEHPCYIHGESDSISYGSSWTDKLKEQVRERDGWCCRVCGKKNHENEKETGYQLNVHHIRPHWKWDFEEHEQMNSPDNLISVCSSCHGRVEGKWQDCNPEEFERRAKELLGYAESLEERSLFAY